MLIDCAKPFSESNLNPETDFDHEVIAFIKEWQAPAVEVRVQTSGSTGKPKVFAIEKKRMRNSAKMTCDFLNLQEGDSALVCLPVIYISGKMMVVRALERKLKLYTTPPSLHPLEHLTQKIDFCALTPLQAEHSLDKLGLIDKLILGGAAVSEQLYNQLKKLPSHIYETYGMSETLSHIALRELCPNRETYFKLFPDIEISTDKRGCLTINAPMLNPKLLQTNDIVEIKGKDAFRFLGRADNIINTGGAKVFPEELEALVKKNLANEVVFLGIPDVHLGQKLIAVVEEPTFEKQEEIKNRFEEISFDKKFHRPKEIFFVQEIPRTPNGKVRRQALTELILKTSN